MNSRSSQYDNVKDLCSRGKKWYLKISYLVLFNHIYCCGLNRKTPPRPPSNNHNIAPLYWWCILYLKGNYCQKRFHLNRSNIGFPIKPKLSTQQHFNPKLQDILSSTLRIRPGWSGTSPLDINVSKSHPLCGLVVGTSHEKANPRVTRCWPNKEGVMWPLKALLIGCFSWESCPYFLPPL